MMRTCCIAYIKNPWVRRAACIVWLLTLASVILLIDVAPHVRDSVKELAALYMSAWRGRTGYN